MYPNFEPKNHIRILTHFVWGAKEPSAVLENEAMRNLFLDIVGQIAEKKGFVLLCSSAHTDHLHLIIDMQKNQKPARIAHTLQEMTSEYFQKEFGQPILWFESFLAVSIARRELPELTDYLANHQRHHLNKTFRQEFFELIHNE